MTADLDIPGAAYKAVQDAIDRHAVEHNGQRVTGKGAVALVVGVAAPLIVAAELRRIVEEIARSLTHLPTTTDADHYFYAGVRDTADGLTRRADELDPPAGTRED